MHGSEVQSFGSLQISIYLNPDMNNIIMHVMAVVVTIQ